MPYATLAKFSAVFVWIIRYLPPSILMLLAPSLNGLVVFRNVSSDDCHQAVSFDQSTLGARSPGQELSTQSGAAGRCTTARYI
jgi:hypothetical protein